MIFSDKFWVLIIFLPETGVSVSDFRQMMTRTKFWVKFSALFKINIY
ncbi:Uncharacterized protein dnm_038180 [Desulfonema magnum]|uniref:Uncharacterized protein n=1 Tax=Desulfonema magnum TaxID=45655 RepID=A0A975BLQ0_9BACT|nr:Uncharacterized protein dnm_038180 [Desulfonema magnum]